MKGAGVIIRAASPADDAAVGALIRSLDPTDYLVVAWPQWVRRSTAVCLVAEAAGAIVGCVYGEPTVGEDAWMQGARVDPRFRRAGVASELMRTVHDELYRRGSRAVFGTISAYNEASLAMVERLGWRAVARISRRRAPLRVLRSASDPRTTPTCDVNRVCEQLRAGGGFASRRELSYFRRRYFTMSPGYVAHMIELSAIRVSADHSAAAVLELQARESVGSVWVIGLAGEAGGIVELLHQLSGEAASTGKDLLIDANDTPAISPILDEMAFEEVHRDERFVVVRTSTAGLGSMPS